MLTLRSGYSWLLLHGQLAGFELILLRWAVAFQTSLILVIFHSGSLSAVRLELFQGLVLSLHFVSIVCRVFISIL